MIHKLMILLSFLSLAIPLSVQAKDDFICIHCPPQMPIDSSTILQLNQQSGGESIPIDLIFGADSDQLLLIHDRSKTIILKENDRQSTFLHLWSLNSIDSFVVWDIETSIEIPHLCHVTYSTHLDLSTSGDNIGNITFWDMEEHNPIQTIQGRELPITDMLFHPTNDWLAAVSDYQQIGIYTLGEEEVQWLDLPEESDFVSNVTFNSDGSLLAVGVDDTIVIWDTDTLLPFVPATVTEGQVQYVLFHPQETYGLFTIDGEDATSWEWNDELLETQSTLQTPVLEAENPVVTAATISPDGSVLIVVYNQRQIVVWNTETGDIIDVPALSLLRSEDDPRDIYDVAFSPDSMWLAFGTGWGLVFFVVP